MDNNENSVQTGLTAGMQKAMEIWANDPLLSLEDSKRAKAGLVSSYEILQAYKEDLNKVQAQEVTNARISTEAAGGKHTDDDTYMILKKQGIHDVTLTQGPLAQMFFPGTDTVLKVIALRDKFIENNGMAKAFPEHFITPEELLATIEKEGLSDTVGKQLNLPKAASKVSGLRDKFLPEGNSKDKDFGI